MIPGFPKLVFALLGVCIILDFEESDSPAHPGASSRVPASGDTQHRTETSSLLADEKNPSPSNFPERTFSVADLAVSPRVIFLSVPLWVAGGSQAFNNAVISVYMEEYFAMTETKIAAFFVLFGLIQAVPMLIVGYIIRTSLNNLFNICGSALGAIGFSLMLLTAVFESWRVNFVIILSACLSYSSQAIVFVATFAILGDSITKNTLREQEAAIKILIGSWNLAVFSTGRLFASFITAGILLDNFGFQKVVACQLLWTTVGTTISIIATFIKEINI